MLMQSDGNIAFSNSTGNWSNWNVDHALLGIKGFSF